MMDYGTAVSWVATIQEQKKYLRAPRGVPIGLASISAHREHGGFWVLTKTNSLARVGPTPYDLGYVPDFLDTPESLDRMAAEADRGWRLIADLLWGMDFGCVTHHMRTMPPPAGKPVAATAPTIFAGKNRHDTDIESSRNMHDTDTAPPTFPRVKVYALHTPEILSGELERMDHESLRLNNVTTRFGNDHTVVLHHHAVVMPTNNIHSIYFAYGDDAEGDGFDNNRDAPV